MNFVQSIILGIVEGFTEFLPISSTGHLILTSHILELEQTNFLKSFEIAIQLGAILSIVFLYWKSLILKWQVIQRVIAAFIPTATLGVIFYGIFKNYLLDKNIVLWALFLGGFILIIFELFHKENGKESEEISDMPIIKSFYIGIFQAVAIIPGVSRAAATIVGGLFLGLKRKTVVEFSFLLAVPTMLAATLYDLARSSNEFSSDQISFLIVGFIASFIVAVLSVKFLLYYIKNHSFISFGIYRIVLAILFWLIIL